MTPSDPPPLPGSDEALLAECRIETFRAGGKGGQHQNTTNSGVRLVHLATGLRSESRSERSQTQNRRRALAQLRKKLKALHHRPAKRIPTAVPRSQKRKRLKAKRKRADVKKRRRPPDPEAD